MSGGGSCGCGQANCGCCEGIRALTPRAIHNRPGLGALDVRIGTHGSFLATMKARLTSHVLEPGRTRPLAGLRVRDDDAAIALLEGWASVADVLTFYQERIVNEGYLRTATEMRSVHGLAGLVGYTPRPGVAASVLLSYTVDEKASDEVIIPKGARSQAVPGPGELPQYFETSQDLPARAAWNRLGVRQTEPLWWRMGIIEGAREDERELYLAGTATRLQPGDPLLAMTRSDVSKDGGGGEDRWSRRAVLRVMAVHADIEADRTRIRVELWAPPTPPAPPPAPSPSPPPAHDNVAELRANAPAGKIAARIVALLDGLPAPGTDPREARMRLTRMRAAVATELARAQGLSAPRLRAWAVRVDDMLAAAISPDVPPHEPPQRCRVETLVERLAVRPAAAPTGELKLEGSLKSRFEPAGDAGLTMLSRTSPDLGAQLAAGLAGCVADAEPPIRVFALRLRANLFGHNAPKQRKTVTSLETTTTLSSTSPPAQRITTSEIGEWPIVSPGAVGGTGAAGFIRREQPDRLYLDGGHDGILPRSWLFVDMTGVTDFRPSPGNSPITAVARSGSVLVAQVASVQSKTTRADYGMVGGVTRLVFEGQDRWIVLATDAELIANNRRLLQQQIADQDYEVIRGTTVYAVSEELALAESPIGGDVCVPDTSEFIELDGLYLGLEPGRCVTVSGERTDIDDTVGVTGVEPAMIAAVAHDVRAAGADVEPWTHAVRRVQGAVRRSIPAARTAATQQRAAAGPIPVPIPAPMSFVIAEDTILNGFALVGTPFAQFRLEAAPAHGTATVDAVTGAFEYRPAADFNGVDGFSINLVDPTGRATTIAVQVTVTPVDDAPGPAGPQDFDVDERGFELPGKFPGDRLHTFIWLDKPLSYCYRRASLAIHANVVKATHGESQQEILGNGDGAKPYQTIALKHAPLTWLPSPTPEGAEDTLDVYVNNIRWNGVASFTDLPPTARAYMVRTDHKGVSSVVFGDGREGARLPTGGQNVAARYRSGIGKAGNVRAGQIQQLVTRPLGVKEVVNPYRASGGADPDSVDQTRANAPLATAALGRLVATRDYADFARTFAGIGKADAIEFSDGRRSIVHVTVAGQDDIPIDPGSDLMAALRSAFRDLGDPFQAVVIEPRELILLVVQATLRIDADRLWEPVVTAVRAALLAAFGFERRSLGQGIAASEILKVIQAVDGVAMVDLDVFGGLRTTAAAAAGRRPLTPSEIAAAMSELIADTARHGVKSKVDARRAGREGAALRPADIVVLSPDVAATLVLNRIKEPA